PTTHTTWLSKWAELYLKPLTEPDYTPGVWASEIIYNQSVIGAANRWTQTAMIEEEHQISVTKTTAAFTASQLKLGILTVAFAAGLVALLGLVGRKPIVEPEADERLRTAHGTTLVLCGMLLFSPMSSPAHFGVLLLPAFLFLLGTGTLRWPGIVALTLAAIAGNKDLVGPAHYTRGLWLGLPMLATSITLIVTVALMLWPAGLRVTLPLPKTGRGLGRPLAKGAQAA
ncbi:MAG: hypothetical protein ACRCZF_23165, partial [Gemmataceae bacterium]